MSRSSVSKEPSHAWNTRVFTVTRFPSSSTSLTDPVNVLSERYRVDFVDILSSILLWKSIPPQCNIQSELLEAARNAVTYRPGSLYNRTKKIPLFSPQNIILIKKKNTSMILCNSLTWNGFYHLQQMPAVPQQRMNHWWHSVAQPVISNTWTFKQVSTDTCIFVQHGHQEKMN